MEKLVITKDMKLKPQMYKDKNYDEIILEEGVKEIPSMCFENCGARKVIFPSSLESIGYRAFAENNFDVVDLSNTKVTQITMECFINCGINNLLLPKNLKSIMVSSFMRNNIQRVNLPESLTSLGAFCFIDNPISEITVPDKVKSIGRSIIDTNGTIYYKNNSFDSEFLKSKGSDTIIKYMKLLGLNVVSRDVLNNFPKEAIANLKIDKEDVKGFVIHYKLYSEIIRNAKTDSVGFDKEWYLSSIFKMCYVLGLFNKPDEKVFVAIKKMIYDLTEQDMKRRWDVNLNYDNEPYIPKFKEFFMKVYLNNEEDLYNGDVDITKLIYNNFEHIKKWSYKNKSSLLSRKQKELKNYPKDSEVYIAKKGEIYELKKTLKEVDVKDALKFVESTRFKLRAGNERLKEVLLALSLNMSEKDFDRVQDMYEESRKVTKSIPFTTDKIKEGFTYKWVLSDDPINLLLGIIMGCCSRIGGIGEDIMRQSMINPDVTNLVLYDENGKIVGKSTLYFNKEKKYILFNNIETKEIGTKGIKSAEERKIELLNTVLRAIEDLVMELKKQGIEVEKVAVGLGSNDLKDEIEDRYESSKTNLLEQYPWESYHGDADEKEGQAILYEDKNAKTK